MLIVYIAFTIILSSLRSTVTFYCNNRLAAWPLADAVASRIADISILAAAVWYLGFLPGALVAVLSFFSIPQITLGWLVTGIPLMFVGSEQSATRIINMQEIAALWLSILYIIFLVVSFFVVDRMALYHAISAKSLIVFVAASLIGLVIRTLLKRNNPYIL